MAEVRRVRSLLEARAGTLSDFDLSDAIAPVIACARASGSTSLISASGFVVYGSGESTAQVLVALLDNARKHAPSSPVEVHAAVTTCGAVLYVDDRGSGISGSSCERVFDTASAATTVPGPAWVCSSPAGSWPNREGRSPSATVPGEAHRSRSLRSPEMSGRVLIVEDHSLVAIGLQLALRARGWEVTTTDGPTAAAIIEHANQFQPQCVLLDIGLGDIVGSGIDLMTRYARPAPKW